MTAKTKARGAIKAMSNQNAMAPMAMIFCHVLNSVALTVGNSVIDLTEIMSWERITMHAVPGVRYMGKGTEGVPKMQDAINRENEGVKILVQVHQLVNPNNVRQRSQNGKIAAT